MVDGVLGARVGGRSSYVGRRGEARRLRTLLAQARLVTLTGVGGVGKTRLALRVAEEISDRFADGVCLVELAELDDPALLADLVADRLGLRDQLARHTAEDAVTEYLRPRQVLLVLDNCEHLVAACAALLGRLLPVAAGLVVLATGRQSLGVPEERVYPVPPLEVPPAGAVLPAALGRYDAVRLFADRAGAVVPSFRLTADNGADVADLVRRLDGLPLAIELAAARIRTLSVRQMTARLAHGQPVLVTDRRRPARQRTLHDSIELTYQLCSPAERAAWAALSVFPESFDLAAAEHVAGRFTETPAAELIDGLVDKSVLSRGSEDGPERYRMLSTLREYGRQRLTESGERRRAAAVHRDWVVGLLAACHAEWISPRQLEWMVRLRREYANIRAALEFCVTEPGQAGTVLRHALALEHYWSIASRYGEARRWLDRALAAAPADAPERRYALGSSGLFAAIQGDNADAVARLREATGMAHRATDEPAAVYTALVAGFAEFFSGNISGAAELSARAVTRTDSFGDPHLRMYARWLHGLCTGLAGDFPAALTVLRELVAISHRQGEVFWRGQALHLLAHNELLAGNTDAARAAAIASLRLPREAHSLFAVAISIDILAFAAQRHGHEDRAAALSGAADTLWSAQGAGPDAFPGLSELRTTHRTLARRALGEHRFDQHYTAARALTAEQAVAYALDDSRPPPGGRGLTRREREIAGLVADGLTNRDIATRLTISPRTVEKHVDNILGKLAVRNRGQIAAWTTGHREAAD
ncbi:LuxR C-terminal-related transcriptional regulator [Amycolatopsis anabasis]|uniref:LuxR C-terminal-related transcriptional regulator n=1 Tax=Amycolatopsis anabasis TaxID=1840409 RepID=UPI00131CA814|nr:LuxR C-terminal-related transcriptional regulator [Amycolatopsis anabasis]